MVQLRFSDGSSTSEPTGAAWSYWRPGLDDVVEVGTLRSKEVGFPVDFHRENQITFVVAGRRRFLIGGEVIAILPGQGALISSGVARRSVSEPCGVACLNVYAPAGEYDVAASILRPSVPTASSSHWRTRDMPCRFPRIESARLCYSVDRECSWRKLRTAS
jgi:hypothetical protein